MQLDRAGLEFTGVMALTAVFLLACLVLVRGSHMVGRHGRFGFINCIVVMLAMVVIDWFTVSIDGHYPQLHWVHTVATAVEFSLAPVIPVVLAQAIMPNPRTKWIALPLILHALFECASIFGGFVFWVDDANQYHRGAFYMVYIAMYFLSSVYLVVESVRATRLYQTRNNASMAAIVICLAFGVVLQTLVPAIHISWLAVAMAILMYFTYYTDTIQQNDELTRLLNRRSYEHAIEAPACPSVVVSLDIDDFKLVNDTYGHTAGDECLAAVARQIRRVYGPYGLCFRTGGDEFCVLMERGFDAAEELKDSFSAAIAEEVARDSRITTVSVGYSEVCVAPDGMPAAIEQADQMMYRYKRTHKDAHAQEQGKLK